MNIGRSFLVAITLIAISCAPVIKLDDTNSHHVDINIQTKATGLSLYFVNERNRLVKITDIPASGSFRVPNYNQVRMRIYGHNTTTSFIDPSNKFTIERGDDTLIMNVKLRSYKDELRNEYNGFSSTEKRKIHKAYTMFVVARETPRFMFAAKTAEAQGELSIIKSEIHGFSETKLYQKMNDLGTYLKISSGQKYLHELVTPLLELLDSVFNE